MVWHYERNLLVYTIPLMSGLESSLGSTLEVVLDLQESHQKQADTIERLNIPKNITQFEFDLLVRKEAHKTIIVGREKQTILK